jgi:hypothetical protein
MGQPARKRKSVAGRKPKSASEHSSGVGQPAARWKHFAEIVRPDLLWGWVMERNPTLRHFQQALQDWGKRRDNPSRRPLCLACEHAFHPESGVPPAWMFVRLSVNKAGVPRHQGRCDPVAGGVCRTSQGVPRHARVQGARSSALVGRCELMGRRAKKPVQFILTAIA